MINNNAFEMLCWAYREDLAVGAEAYMYDVMTAFISPGAKLQRGGQHLVPTEEGTLSLQNKFLWLHVVEDEKLNDIADIIIAPQKGTMNDEYRVYICLL